MLRFEAILHSKTPQEMGSLSIVTVLGGTPVRPSATRQLMLLLWPLDLWDEQLLRQTLQLLMLQVGEVPAGAWDLSRCVGIANTYPGTTLG